MSLDIIQVSLGNVKVTPAIICNPSIAFDIEFNDVLESILLLLKYIKKTLICQALLGIFEYKIGTFHVCLICLILLFHFVGVRYWYGKKSRHSRVYIRGPP